MKAHDKNRKLWTGILKSRMLTAVGRVILGPVVILLVWQAAVELEVAPPSLLPSPAATISQCYYLFVSGNILRDIAMTGVRTGLGYGLAAVVGIIVGVVVGTYRPLYDVTTPAIDFIRSTPVTIMYPVFVLVLGISHASKIAMVFVGCVFVIVLNTSYGVLQSNKIRQQMAQLYGASRFQVFRWVIFYDSLPQTMVGLRVTLSFALVVEILCEMFMGSQYGLGQRVTEAYTTYAIEEMYALVLIVGAFGFFLNRLFVSFERIVVPWSTHDHR